MPENSYLKKCFAKDPSIVTREVVDELILVAIPQDKGGGVRSHILNEVAAHIWELLDGQRRVEDIRDMLVEEFDVSAEEVEADLVELLQSLEQFGAVRVV